MFRYLLAHWVRQQAREKLHEVVQEEARRQSQHVENGPPRQCEIGFVFALSVEAGGLVDRLSETSTARGRRLVEHVGKRDGRLISIVESGIGRQAATKAAEDVIAVRSPKWIVSAGFAGGLHDEMRRGHILMADTVIDPQGKQLSVGLKMSPETIAATPTLHVGRLLTVDSVVSRPDQKRSLGKEHDAMACDMESIAVAEVCRREKVRFLSVRIILDAVGDALPPGLDRLAQQDSMAGRLGAATGALLRKPSNIKAMWQLKQDAIKASDRLAKFLVGVIPQLV